MGLLRNKLQRVPPKQTEQKLTLPLLPLSCSTSEVITHEVSSCGVLTTFSSRIWPRSLSRLLRVCLGVFLHALPLTWVSWNCCKHPQAHASGLSCQTNDDLSCLSMFFCHLWLPSLSSSSSALLYHATIVRRQPKPSIRRWMGALTVSSGNFESTQVRKRQIFSPSRGKIRTFIDVWFVASIRKKPAKTTLSPVTSSQ